ncbi:penicillin-binding protein 1A [Lysobacter sp. SG-8]|uniref:Penicillin-binding protein 1A n=1 Tax=Marilutibacter penaei TaxID=2759900 RepID=A0A7W3U3K4_9GAMM|nr:penicillin-binding protein 1A [Lysobacter penaei]MBB1088302.1 penicillin-binding protein 1A [Lysobacter penaei]
MSRIRRLLRWALVALLGIAVLGVVALGTLYYVIVPKLPDVQTLRNVELQEPMHVYARDGRLMALYGEMRRYPVRIEDVPERVKQAFIAIEDARFYEHHGVDYKGVARAVWLLATTDDRRVPGGSTITQQVARQFFLDSEYSYMRKLREMLLAMRMEQELSKDEILELYLNKSFFGHRSYGVAAAAEFYYGKTLAELDLDEAASLAGIPKFPSSGNPLSNPERARERRDYILQRMAELGFASETEARAAQAVPMHAERHEPPVQVHAPYVAEMVRQEMVDRYGSEAMTQGYRVTTTIDPTLQAAAQRALRDGLLTYDARHGWHGVEQHLELPAGEDAVAAGKRLKDIPAQANLLPAVVLSTATGQAELALRDGRTVQVTRKNSFGNNDPASLLTRGDVVRLRVTVDAPASDEEPVDGNLPLPAERIRYDLSQLPRAQAALVSLEPENGALRALSGGFSFVGNEFNRATQARRQPGSSFKPFIYASALEKGFNPASIVLDAPVVFRQRNGKVWRPQNSTGNFAGPMRLREALVQSRNLVSVRLLDAIGVDFARDHISKFGFDEADLPPNLSMSLGTASLTPLSVARGYAVFANGGYRVTPWFIDEVRDRNDAVVFKENPAVACMGCEATGRSAAQRHVVDGFNLGPANAAPAAPETPAPAPETTGTAVASPSDGTDAAESDAVAVEKIEAPRVIDNRVAYQVVSMMRDVVRRGTGTPARVLEREDVAGKTGTTNEYRDAWFSGMAGPYVTTVWVGRDNYQSLGRREYGGRAALPIWIDYMRVALDGQPIAANEPPADMVQVSVSADGRLLPQGSGGITEWVKTEDLDRMQSYVDFDDDASPAEESFDIF